MSQEVPFTGRRRKKETSRAVLLGDKLSHVLISGGGIGTIVAVLGVMVFLVAVVVPLFGSAEVEAGPVIESGEGAEPPAAFGLDEYRVLGWKIARDGEVTLSRLDDGTRLASSTPFDAGPVGAVSTSLGSDLAAVGFLDGSVALCRIGFETTFLDESEVEPELLDALLESEPGTPFPLESYDLAPGVVQLTPQRQLRHQGFHVEVVRTAAVADGPVRLIDHVERAAGPLIAVVAEGPDGTTFTAMAWREKEDFFTGGKTLAVDRTVALPYEDAGEPPLALAITAAGTDLYLAWRDGTYRRVFLATDLETVTAPEAGRLVPEGREVTSFDLVLGENTLVWGDDQGDTYGGFAVRRADLEEAGGGDSALGRTEDEFVLVAPKALGGGASPAVAFAASARSRLALTGRRDGSLSLVYVSNERVLAELDVPNGEPILALAFAPKEDGFLVATESATFAYDLDAKHPEASVAALFGRVWYEGYPTQDHTWQSSSGHTGFEPKFGLMPLIVGTIKATLYSMLFGAPLAILAAVYSSEFLRPRVKSAVKPTIELMASLPSVVLGFLAALVFAPFVEQRASSCLAVVVCVPFAFLAAAYLWQTLPSELLARYERLRLLLFAVPLAAGAAAALVVGPLAESLLFAGDLRGWLAWSAERADPTQTRFAPATGGWLVLLLPIAGIATFWLVHRLARAWLLDQAMHRTASALAGLYLAKFALGSALALGLALATGAALDGLGLDPRGSLTVWGIDLSPMGTYVQRNSMIVGFVMGFAIIPIIYTLADDALTSVPRHLRSASLAAGATNWQTAMRVVLPTAMSGIFSALMIGLGRAVGETMIVLMAAGNTPILDLNLFNGFRTLSANIAVELPEAVKDSTHYRTLFLAALVLFVMTFLINTVAESVRLRFRKRAFQL